MVLGLPRPFIKYEGHWRVVAPKKVRTGRSDRTNNLCSGGPPPNNPKNQRYPLGKGGDRAELSPSPLVVIKGRGSPRTTSGLGEHPAFYDTAVRTCVGIQYIFFLLFLLFLISSFSSSSYNKQRGQGRRRRSVVGSVFFFCRVVMMMMMMGSVFFFCRVVVMMMMMVGVFIKI